MKRFITSALVLVTLGLSAVGAEANPWADYPARGTVEQPSRQCHTCEWSRRFDEQHRLEMRQQQLQQQQWEQQRRLDAERNAKPEQQEANYRVWLEYFKQRDQRNRQR